MARQSTCSKAPAAQFPTVSGYTRNEPEARSLFRPDRRGVHCGVGRRTRQRRNVTLAYRHGRAGWLRIRRRRVDRLRARRPARVVCRGRQTGTRQQWGLLMGSRDQIWRRSATDDRRHHRRMAEVGARSRRRRHLVRHAERVWGTAQRIAGLKIRHGSDPDFNRTDAWLTCPGRSRRQRGLSAMANPDTLEKQALRFPTIDDGVKIGHVHLKVADLQRALDFYCGVLGFTLTTSRPGAAFISAGGYHHHIGLNTWESRGGAPPAPGTTGLYHTAILYPTRRLLADALRRLIAAKIPLEGASDHGVSEALYLRDPDDNGVELYWDRPKEMWPKREDGGLRMFTNPLDLHDLLAELDKAQA